MRVAFVHDFLTQFGGGERVLLELRKLYPDAPVYTTVYDRAAFGDALHGVDVRTTWLQRLPLPHREFRALLPLYPRAVESIDLSDFDLVISSTTSFAKGVRTPPKTLHVSYMHTPTRFLWRQDEYAFDIVPAIAKRLLAAVLPSLRRWDLAAAARPTHIVASSHNAAERIRAVYGREADVLHCPATLDGFTPSDEIDDYYLVATRLLPYKRVDIAIRACAQIGARLIVIGDGPDARRLRAIATSRTRFLGRVDDAQRCRLVARARAVIVPGIEDFGLVPIEAAAAGRPAVAFAAGGALETIVEGETGYFFREPTAESLANALQRAATTSFDRSALASQAQRFSPERFRRDMRALIDRYRTEAAAT